WKGSGRRCAPRYFPHERHGGVSARAATARGRGHAGAVADRARAGARGRREVGSRADAAAVRSAGPAAVAGVPEEVRRLTADVDIINVSIDRTGAGVAPAMEGKMDERHEAGSDGASTPFATVKR